MFAKLRPKQRLLVLLAALALLGVSMFCVPWPVEPPGTGEKAERGYAACAPIIEALEDYQNAHGVYPDSLAALVPDYLAEIPAEVNGDPITYQPDAQSYVLTFSYIGLGMNLCAYSPEHDWSCRGAY